MKRIVFIEVVLLVFAIGCSDQPSSIDKVKNAKPSKVEDEKPSIVYDGKRWLLTSDTMDVKVYACIDDPNLVLKDGPDPLVKRRKQIVFTRVGDSLIKHGLTTVYFDNGERDEIPYENNEIHGVVKTWFASGQLRCIQEMRHGQNHGKNTRWYENGQVEYEGRFFDGREVSGQSFNEDGTEYDP